MISIIVPTYREEKIIEKFLSVLKNVLGDRKYEIIIVDDSPDDKTYLEAKKIKEVKVFHRINEIGKGSAVNFGILKAKGEDIVIIDADLEYNPKEIIPMIQKLEEYDIVTSIRKRKDPFYRGILAYLFRFAVYLVLGINFETQSGLKVMKRKIFEKIKIKTKGWAYDAELLAKAKKEGCRIGFHEIEFKRRTAAKSKIKPFFSSISMLRELLEIRKEVK